MTSFQVCDLFLPFDLTDIADPVATQEQIKREVHTRKTCFEAILKRLRNKPRLTDVAHLITENADMLKEFKKDFLSRTLQLGKLLWIIFRISRLTNLLGELISPQTENACLFILDNLISQITSHNPSSEDILASLWVVKHYDSEKFSSLYPLQLYANTFEVI